MGLSESERTRKIVEGAILIAPLIRDLPDKMWGGEFQIRRSELQDRFEKICRFIVRRNSNPLFWLTGSQVGARFKDEPCWNPWQVAALMSFQSYEKLDCASKYDLNELLGQGFDPWLKSYHKIYTLLEFMLYGLQRYDDAFRTDLGNLEAAISEMMVFMSCAMLDSSAYQKAYLISLIFEDIRTACGLPSEVVKALEDLGPGQSVWFIPTEVLLKMHVSLQDTRSAKEKTREALLAAAVLSGGRLHRLDILKEYHEACALSRELEAKQRNEKNDLLMDDLALEKAYHSFVLTGEWPERASKDETWRGEVLQKRGAGV